MIAFDPHLTLMSSATAVARRGPDGSYTACMIRGRPGSGKSSLAMNVIALGASLVSDDVVAISDEGGLTVHAPNEPFSGLFDLREVGLMRIPHVPRARLGFIVDIKPWQGAPDPMQRAPAPSTAELLGRSVPRYKVLISSATAAVLWTLLAGGEVIDPDKF